jgi:hypothetical protein
LPWPLIKQVILSCKVLTGGQPKCSQTVAGVDVLLEQTAEPRMPVDTIVALSLDSSGSAISPITTANGASDIAPVAKK